MQELRRKGKGRGDGVVANLNWRHPERSRFSGGAKDLACDGSGTPRQILRPAGEDAGLQDDDVKPWYLQLFRSACIGLIADALRAGM
jgi:hypothetical protein